MRRHSSRPEAGHGNAVWREHVRRRLPQLAVPAEREIEIVDELAMQLESIYERERRGGASHDAAVAAAEAEVPDWAALARTLTSIEPAARAAATPGNRSGGLMNGFIGDMRFAIRSLRRTPAFTIIAVATLALGLGMAAAAFSVIDTVLVKPLRFGSPDRLVLVHATVPPDNRDTNEIAYPDAMDLARETQAFASVALVTPYSGTATALDPPERITGYNVTPSIFDTLGVQPVLGRAFAADETQPGRNNVVILGHGFWTRLGSRADIIGQTLVLDDVPNTIVGVMPSDFRIEVFTGPDTVYRPMPPDFASAPRTLRGFRAIGKLQDGATIEQAASVAHAVGERLASEYPNSNRGRAFTLSPLHHDIVGTARPALFMIAGLVLLVLLIASVNLTNLLLARAMARAREVALRSALGAGVWRLTRASLIEAGLLAAVGAVAGVAIAAAILSAVVTMPGVALPRLREIGLDWRAIGALAVTAIAASIGVGAVPFLLHRRWHDTAALRTGHETAGRWENRIRSVLVSAQTALAFILIAATALLTISLQRLLAVPSGFASGIATMRIAAPAARYPTREQTTRFYNDLADEIAAQPGISKAGFVSILPLSGNTGSVLTVQGREDIPMTERPEVGWHWADAGYFDAMGMPILRGRGFARADLDSPNHVTVISATLARKHFGDEDPIGKRVYFGGIPAAGVPEWHEIIGVVGDVRHRSLETEPDARAYDLFGQHWGRTVSLALRTTTSPQAAAGTVRAVLARRDPRLAVFAVQSTDDIVSNAVATRRLLLSLVAGFAAVGFAVAMLGVYGIVSCLVAERQREIGVRVALGATTRSIHRLVLGHGFKLVAFGLIAGVAGAIALRRGIEAQLFGVSPANIPALAGVALALLIAAAIPCLIVSRRATRIDPVRALRSE
jgi:predicted permease